MVQLEVTFETGLVGLAIGVVAIKFFAADALGINTTYFLGFTLFCVLYYKHVHLKQEERILALEAKVLHFV